ncbi:MAG: hypothetical protein WBQ31_05530, partial [Candidatus Acidiferrales bacterium]
MESQRSVQADADKSQTFETRKLKQKTRYRWVGFDMPQVLWKFAFADCFWRSLLRPSVHKTLKQCDRYAQS